MLPYEGTESSSVRDSRGRAQVAAPAAPADRPAPGYRAGSRRSRSASQRPTGTTALKNRKPRRAQRAFEKSLAAAPEGKYFLRLYVAGATARSRQALRRVSRLCEQELKDNYELEVIDVYQQPELARKNQIVATPTLVKEAPRPVRRLVGNLLNTAGLFREAGPTGKDKHAP